MVGKTAREYPQTEEEQLSEAAKAAFGWQGTCYGAFTYLQNEVIYGTAHQKNWKTVWGGILITLYEKSEENRVQREAREETERKRIEEARKKKNFAKEKSRKFVVFMNL